jgi:hypothetical protein
LYKRFAYNRVCRRHHIDMNAAIPILFALSRRIRASTLRLNAGKPRSQILRLATSAVAVITGLVLAAVIFGQPALYVGHARQRWNALFVDTRPVDTRPVDPRPVVDTRPVVDSRPADPGHDPRAPQAAELQQQVIELTGQLAASQSATAQARQQFATLEQQLAESQTATNEGRQQLTALQQQLAATQAAADQARQQVAALQQQLAPAADRSANPAGAVSTPEHHEAPKPPPPPLPKPKIETAAPRTDPDDMQSVMSRLRQRPYSAAAADNAAQQSETRPTTEATHPPSLARKRLEMARQALMNGRVDDARRLLQEVQVQLVFRPVSPGADDAPAAGQGAFDVARALGSLSGTDTSLSQHYIERAMDDVAGANSQVTESVSGPLTGGYAPAYPTR